MASILRFIICIATLSDIALFTVAFNPTVRYRNSLSSIKKSCSNMKDLKMSNINEPNESSSSEDVSNLEGDISVGEGDSSDLKLTEEESMALVTAPANGTEPVAVRELTWTAAVKSSVRVKEIIRTSEAYMRLPASEYSVLSANQIVRLSASEFRCELPMMNFFGTKIQPILYVDVNVYPEFNRSEIVVRRAETVGSETALAVNGTFSINAVNVVSAETDDKGRKTLNSDTKLKIDVQVPPSRFPMRVIQTGGNFLMQSSLNIIVPTFVRILSADFQRWSAGNDTRAEVDGATLTTV
mmetsp:Transcript_4925/g.5079  ORF Transcript_4925/g.5079 Transcript_4925/m.5079 type:complete len:297 (+) Transcript_4925:144-1034(+)